MENRLATTSGAYTGGGLSALGQVVLCVLSIGRVDGGRLDEADRDRGARFFQLHAQGVGEALDGVLRRAVHALPRNGAVGQRAADVDERAAAVAEMLGRDAGPVDDPPKVRVQQAPVIRVGDVGHTAIDRHAGVVDPGVKAAKARNGQVRHDTERRFIGDVGDLVHGLAALPEISLLKLAHARLIRELSTGRPQPPSGRYAGDPATHP